MKINTSKKTDTFIVMGIIGLAIVASLNLFANTMLIKPATEPFTSGWYSTWYPSYLIWFVFLIAGLAKHSAWHK